MKIRGNPLLHLADKWLGRLFIFLLLPFKQKKEYPYQIQSIGIMKLGGIGDLILLTGCLVDIRCQFPQAKIILFCGVENFALNVFLPKTIQIERINLKNPLKCLKVMRRHELHVLLDFGQWSRIEALLSFFSRSQFIIGYKTKRQHRHYLYNAVCEHSELLHEIENYRMLASKMGFYSNSKPKLEKPILLPILYKIPRSPFIVFHPWSAGVQKRVKEWSIQNWVSLGRLLLREGYSIVITGGRSDIESSLHLQNLMGNQVLNLAGKFDLPSLVCFLEQCSCFVTINTGVMHLAASFDIPMVILNGPVSVKRWGPLGDRIINLTPPREDWQYISLGFEFLNNPPPSSESQTVGQVYNAIHQMIPK